MLRSILIATTLIFSAADASAQVMIGLGGQTCGAWTTNNPTSGAGIGLYYQQWVYGFLSGVSFADPEHGPLKGLEIADLTKSMDAFCAKNPNSRIADAAIAFVQEKRKGGVTPPAAGAAPPASR